MSKIVIFVSIYALFPGQKIFVEVYHPHKSFNNVLLNGPKYNGHQTFWLTVSPTVTVHMQEECVKGEDDYASIVSAYLVYEIW